MQDISIYLEGGNWFPFWESAVGKTTLFNAFRYYPPDEGRSILKDQDVTSTPEASVYMLQKDLLLPPQESDRQCSTSLVLKGVKKAEARKSQSLCRIWSGRHSISIKPAVRWYASACGLLRTYLSSAGCLLDDFQCTGYIDKGQRVK